MREELERELLNAIVPYINNDDLEDVKMKITMVVGNYEISERTTELTVYQQDETQKVLNKFFAAKAAAGRSKRTLHCYRKSITASLHMIDKPYDQITADDIRLYLALRVQRDKVTKTTANNERRNLSAFFTWLQKEEILLKNPMAKVDVIKETKVKKKAFSEMELEKIRAACETERDATIVEMLISTWCRVTELTEIRIDDIQDGKLTVHGKGDKNRDVYMTAKAQIAVQKYLDKRMDGNPYLFPKADKPEGFFKGDKRGMRLWYENTKYVDEKDHCDKGTIENIVRRIGKDAGVPNTHPHRFRRTGATMALKRGMPLTLVSKMLGHESIATTQIYLDITDDELEQAHRKYVT